MSLRTRLAVAAAAFLPAAAAAPQAPVPARLAMLAAQARIEGKIVAWCSGSFEARRARAYAIAVASPAGGGQYLVLGLGGAPVVLAAFRDGADLACHSAARARKLDQGIHASGSLHGSIAPKWRSTVVCGFVENTSAVCWQYSPAARAFVKVGGWIT